jgi:hypothetical protein
VFPIIDFFIAHEAAVHAAKLRVELSEQQQYLKNVEFWTSGPQRKRAPESGIWRARVQSRVKSKNGF